MAINDRFSLQLITFLDSDICRLCELIKIKLFQESLLQDSCVDRRYIVASFDSTCSKFSGKLIIGGEEVSAGDATTNSVDHEVNFSDVTVHAADIMTPQCRSEYIEIVD